MRRQYDGQSDAGHAIWPISGTVMNGEKTLYSSHYYRFQRDFMKALARRVGFDLSVVTVHVPSLNILQGASRVAHIKEAASIIQGHLRKTDQLFDRFTEEGSFAILLPGAREEGARTVIARLERALLSCSSALFGAKALAFGIQPLYVRTPAKT